MEPTHFLYLARPPRPTFPGDASAAELATLGQHFAFMDRVRADGKLVLTGPALDGSYGIAIFKVTTHAEADALVKTDPAVVAGMFTYTIHPLSIGPITP